MRKIITYIAPAFMLLLVGCSPARQVPVQKAQKVKPSVASSLDMEQLCRQNAAHRYNTGAQQLDVTAFEQFQGSYEMRGTTPRHEAFVCSFDAEGQFLHLSMR